MPDYPGKSNHSYPALSPSPSATTNTGNLILLIFSIIVLIMIGSGVLLILQKDKYNTDNITILNQEIQNKDKQISEQQDFKTANLISNWYSGAETIRYKLFYTGIDTNNVVVLEKNTLKLLIPESTCEKEIPENLKREDINFFYNDSVGIIKTGPYKSISAKEGSADTFLQKVQNAGCVSQEGEIKFKRSETEGRVDCDINIEYKHLGC